MKLTNPSDEELDEAFAIHVCKWRRSTDPELINSGDWWEDENGGTHIMGGCGTCPDYYFSTSANAVLPWLEKYSRDTDKKLGGEGIVFRLYSPACAEDTWTVVEVELHHDGQIEGAVTKHQSLPRAIVITLLRAHGVEVEFTAP